MSTLAITPEARDALQALVCSGHDPRRLVVHVERQRVSVSTRADLAKRLRGADETGLARLVSRAAVPLGCVLLVVDGDEQPITSVSLASLQVDPRLPSLRPNTSQPAYDPNGEPT